MNTGKAIVYALLAAAFYAVNIPLFNMTILPEEAHEISGNVRNQSILH